MIAFSRPALAVQALVLASGWLACSRVETGEQAEPVVKWVPAGQPLPASRPAKAAGPATPAPAPEVSCPTQPAPDNRDIVAAIQKVAEACRAPAAFPAPQEPSEPEAAPVSWPPAGPQVVDALAVVLAGMNQSALGFRPNDPVIGKIMDNGTNEQAGGLEAVQAYVRYLAGRAAPGNADPLARTRAALLEGDLAKWWFPSGEKTLAQGIAALQDTSAAMKSGAIKAPGGPEDLKGILLISSSLLSREADKISAQDVAETDDAFHHARGTAAATAAVVEGAVASYAPALKDRGAGNDLKQALDSLQTVQAMDPLIVLAGPPGALRGNHPLLMAYYLDRAADALSTAAARLN